MPDVPQKIVSTEDFIASVFERAIKERASDVHFETMTSALRIRFRIDGILLDRWSLPTHQLEPVINSLKVLASLDISNHEVSQDGHFELFETVNVEEKSSDDENASANASTPKTVLAKTSEKGAVKEKISGDKNVTVHPPKTEQRVLDIRISVYPTINGEVVVARILNRPNALRSLSELGMGEDTLRLVKNLIYRDYGMVLITGPVGSGKTTSLYSLVQELKSKEKNIMTIEDPVEFHIEWLRQSELKPERGFTFDKAMRSILRQDPDVIMIGEIRDPEAAQHAISLSLIGRIVGSTVHSNSTIGTVARLIDMEIERSMIAYAINGIISQRLVRKICLECREPYEPEASQLSYFGLKKSEFEFVKGKGCETCHGSGYFGRVGIFEVLEFDNKLRSLIVDRTPMSGLEAYTVEKGMKTLKQDAVEKVLAGITTVEEISKIV